MWFLQNQNCTLWYRNHTCLGPKTCSIVPDEVRESASLETFRQKIKSWKPDGCPCCICKKYIENVGFVNLSCIPIG